MSLWTSITGAVRSVAAVAAPVVGAVYGGPAGAAFGKALSSAIAPRSYMPGPVGPSAPGAPTPGGSGMQRTAGQIPKYAVGAMGALRNWIISARGIVSTMGGRILGVMRGTKLFRSAQVTKLAKQVGLEAAAVALGISAVEVAQIIAADIQRPRRRARGISARDVRTTRRTIGKIRTIERGLRESGICRTPVRRKAA